MKEPRDEITGSDQLTPKQLNAIDLLCAGQTQEAAAKAIGVHRVTVSNWFRKDPRFKAEMHRRLKERSEAASIRVQSIVDDSLGVLEEAITKERDWKAAGTFLRLVAAHGYLGKPVAGPAHSRKPPSKSSWRMSDCAQSCACY